MEAQEKEEMEGYLVGSRESETRSQLVVKPNFPQEIVAGTILYRSTQHQHDRLQQKLTFATLPELERRQREKTQPSECPVI
jgi:hypothetical protein